MTDHRWITGGKVHGRSRDYSSGVGLAAGGSMPKVAAVMQVMEKLPVPAIGAWRGTAG